MKVKARNYLFLLHLYLLRWFKHLEECVYLCAVFMLFKPSRDLLSAHFSHLITLSFILKFITSLKFVRLLGFPPRTQTFPPSHRRAVTVFWHVVCDLFIRCVQSNIILLTQAFRKKFVIPDFQAFTSHIDDLYENSKSLSGGQVCLQLHPSPCCHPIHPRSPDLTVAGYNFY